MDKAFLKELAEYVAIPSVSAQPQHKADCVKTAKWVSGKLSSMGMKAKLIPTGGHPLVYGRLITDKRAPHILIYGHYDVQPAEPFELWKTPPFKLTRKGDRLYARGSADNKGPTLALLTGLKNALPKMRCNITCLIEGEEECGCNHLTPVLQKLKKVIGKVDIIILSDTASLSREHLTVAMGMRGVMGIEVSVRGLRQDLHSGHGGPVPNAVRELCRVVEGLYDSQGWVTIPGFYNGCKAPSKAEIASIREQLDSKQFAREIGARGYYPLDGENPLVANRFYPSLEINGVTGGYQGEGMKTIVPATAHAKITCRIAAGQDHLAFQKNVISEIKKRVNSKLFSCEVLPCQDVQPGYAINTEDPFTAKALKLLDESCKNITGNKVLFQREGASIPIIASFKRIFQSESVMLGLFTDDSALHSPNENVDIRILENGIKVWEGFFKRIGR